MPKRTVDYNEGLRTRLQDPAYAAEYLSAAAEDSEETFLLALREVAESRGMSRVAETSELNREGLYRMLSEEGNPRLSSLWALLDAFGLKLAFVVVGAEPPGAGGA